MHSEHVLGCYFFCLLVGHTAQPRLVPLNYPRTEGAIFTFVGAIVTGMPSASLLAVPAEFSVSTTLKSIVVAVRSRSSFSMM